MNYINIGNRMVNHYLLQLMDGYLVIDTGYQGGFQRFCHRLSQRQINLGDIKYIFLTHAHDDHAGYLGDLLTALPEAKLVLDSRAPERLQAGENQMVGGCPTVLSRLAVGCMGLVGKGHHTFPTLDVSERAILWDGDKQLFQEWGIPLTILSLPGHTADSIGLLTEDKQLFCGDAAMNGFPSTHRNIIWIEDLPAYRDSWDVMLESTANTIFPAHGKPFPVEDLKKYRHSLDHAILG